MRAVAVGKWKTINVVPGIANRLAEKISRPQVEIFLDRIWGVDGLGIDAW